MELQLKNIGMIKEANVKLDGLTVIAGENDTGKSTVGKALFVILQGIASSKEENKNESELINFEYYTIFQKVFKQNKLEKNGLIALNTKHARYYMEDDRGNTISGTSTCYRDKYFEGIVFIETPLVWNFTDFFRDIALIESQKNIVIDYPYLMKDLNFKLFIKNASDGLDIKNKMTSLMGGEFKKDEMGRYYFDKAGQRIELLNTATGIKYFGIFQVLSQNNYLNENTVLVLDEPEVHLHPKWQLEMAKVIVELVKNGVKVLVNSHSPYMIEALERYAEKEEITADFYLAEDGYIKKENDSNSETLAKIFEKLSEPFDVFEEMDMQRLLNV
jgi:predicted ATPase